MKELFDELGIEPKVSIGEHERAYVRRRSYSPHQWREFNEKTGDAERFWKDGSHAIVLKHKGKKGWRWQYNPREGEPVAGDADDKDRAISDVTKARQEFLKGAKERLDADLRDEPKEEYGDENEHHDED
jgi:hypothetical protein